MISFTGIKNRFNKRAHVDLGTTVRNLTRSFTSYDRSPSPETPRVARNLDRAREDAKDTIAYMDDIMSTYPVANDNDDQDEYDNPPTYSRRPTGLPAYYRRQARGIHQAPKKSKVRQLVRQFEYQGTPSIDDDGADDGGEHVHAQQGLEQERPQEEPQA